LKLKKLFSEASIYTISNVINRAIPFLLLPVLTRYLEPSEYGVFVMVQVVGNFLIPIIGINSQAAVQRVFFLLDKSELKKYLSNTLIISSFVLLLLIIIYIVLGNTVARWLFIPPFWLLMSVILTAGEVIKNLFLSLMQAERRAKKYAFFNITQTVVRFILTIIPVILFKDKLNALLWGYFISLMIFSVFSLFYFIKEDLIVINFNLSHAKSFLKYGIPLIPHSIGSWFMGMADRIIIGNKLTLADVGLYNIGFSFGTGVGLLQDAFNRAWVPYLYDGLTKKDETTKIELTSFIILYSIAIFILAAIIAAATPIFFLFLGPKYQYASTFVVWISFAYAFNGIYKMFTNFIFFSEKTYFLSFITLFSGLLELFLVFYLIDIFGLIGAAYAFLITQIVLMIITFYYSNKLYPLPIKDAYFKILIKITQRK
jgi:O-antigen/teichoic acid export membrane protein